MLKKINGKICSGKYLDSENNSRCIMHYYIAFVITKAMHSVLIMLLIK
jgi:hypothetical protein